MSSRPFDETDPELGNYPFPTGPAGGDDRGLDDTDPRAGSHLLIGAGPETRHPYPRPWYAGHGDPPRTGVPSWLVIVAALVVAGVILLGAAVLLSITDNGDSRLSDVL